MIFKQIRFFICRKTETISQTIDTAKPIAAPNAKALGDAVTQILQLPAHVQQQLNTDMLNNQYIDFLGADTQLVGQTYAEAASSVVQAIAQINMMPDVSADVKTQLNEIQAAIEGNIDSGNNGLDNQKVFVENPFKIEGGLKPNIKYQSGEYDYIYETDRMGRIIKFDTMELKSTKRFKRLNHSANSPGKNISTDHAGHIVGDQFGGSPKLDNIVTQLKEVNLSKYRKLENSWAKAIKEGKVVQINIKIKYEGDSLRPSVFVVKYKIDGETFCETISNVENLNE